VFDIMKNYITDWQNHCLIFFLMKQSHIYG